MARRGLKYSKLTPRQTGELLQLFVAGSTARTAVDLVGVHRNTAALFFSKVRAGIPARLAYEWDGTTGTFTAVADPRERQFTENVQAVLAVLHERSGALTHGEILRHWPDESSRPGETTLYEWLNRATAQNLIRRVGKGTKLSPWRYSLPTASPAPGLSPFPDLPPLGDWHD